MLDISLKTKETFPLLLLNSIYYVNINASQTVDCYNYLLVCMRVNKCAYLTGNVFMKNSFAIVIAELSH